MARPKSHADTTFFRIGMDGSETPLSIDNMYLGYRPSPCFIVGGAPSLKDMPLREINEIAVPKMVINNAATLVHPTFWIAFDTANKFLPWVYKSHILKFQPASRWNNIVPETKSVKACECPGAIYYRNETGVGFRDFFDPNRKKVSTWSFSFIEAIQVALYLGFRRLYLIGVSFEMSTAEGDDRYAWEETCGPKVANQRNSQYERVAQQFRQCRVNLAQHGAQIISCTPDSVLDDFAEGSPYDVFVTKTIDEALTELEQEIGDQYDPAKDLYQQKPGVRNFKTKHKLVDHAPQGWGTDLRPPMPNGQPLKPGDVKNAPVPRQMPQLQPIDIGEDELRQANEEAMRVARRMEAWIPPGKIQPVEVDDIDFGVAIEQ